MEQSANTTDDTESHIDAWIAAAKEFCERQSSFTDLILKTYETQMKVFGLEPILDAPVLASGLYVAREAARTVMQLRDPLDHPDGVRFVDSLLLAADHHNSLLTSGGDEVIGEYAEAFEHIAADILLNAKERDAGKYGMECATLGARIGREITRRRTTLGMS